MANVTNPWAVTPFPVGANQPFGYSDQWSKWLRDSMGANSSGNFGAELGLSGSDYGDPAQQQNVITSWIAKMQQALPSAYLPHLSDMAQTVQRQWYADQTANRTLPTLDASGRQTDIRGTLAERFGSFDPERYFRENSQQFGLPAQNFRWRFL